MTKFYIIHSRTKKELARMIRIYLNEDIPLWGCSMCPARNICEHQDILNTVLCEHSIQKWLSTPIKGSELSKITGKEYLWE